MKSLCLCCTTIVAETFARSTFALASSCCFLVLRSYTNTTTSNKESTKRTKRTNIQHMHSLQCEILLPFFATWFESATAAFIDCNVCRLNSKRSIRMRRIGNHQSFPTRTQHDESTQKVDSRKYVAQYRYSRNCLYRYRYLYISYLLFLLFGNALLVPSTEAAEGAAASVTLDTALDIMQVPDSRLIKEN